MKATIEFPDLGLEPWTLCSKCGYASVSYIDACIICKSNKLYYSISGMLQFLYMSDLEFKLNLMRGMY